MPRLARIKQENSIYHITARGNNKQDIFLDQEDREQYLKRLRRYKERYKIDIYAYCLMTNHVHLLIYDNGQDISRVMQGLSLSYAMYFNRKYNRSGHLFQERFNSVIVNNQRYLIYVSKYIHLNPVRANLVQRAIEYKWSSFKIYQGQKDTHKIVDIKALLFQFSNRILEAIKIYGEYCGQQLEEVDNEIAITQETEERGSFMGKGMLKCEIDRLIQYLKQKYGNLKNKMNKMKMMYLVALISRVSNKGLGKIFSIREENVCISLKKFIELMIKEHIIWQQINNEIKTIEKYFLTE